MRGVIIIIITVLCLYGCRFMSKKSHDHHHHHRWLCLDLLERKGTTGLRRRVSWWRGEGCSSPGRSGQTKQQGLALTTLNSM